MQVRIVSIGSCHRVCKLVGIWIVEVNQVLTRDVDTYTLDTNALEPLLGQRVGQGDATEAYAGSTDAPEAGGGGVDAVSQIRIVGVAVLLHDKVAAAVVDVLIDIHVVESKETDK